MRYSDTCTARLTGWLCHSTDQCRKLQAKLKALHSERDQLTNDLEEQSQTSESLRTELADLVAAHKQECSSLKTTAEHELHMHRESSIRDCDLLKEQVDKLTKGTEWLINEKEELEAQVKALAADKSELTSQLVDSQSEVEGWKMQQCATSCTRDNLAAELEVAKVQLESMEDDSHTGSLNAQKLQRCVARPDRFIPSSLKLTLTVSLTLTLTLTLTCSFLGPHSWMLLCQRSNWVGSLTAEAISRAGREKQRDQIGKSGAITLTLTPFNWRIRCDARAQ